MRGQNALCSMNHPMLKNKKNMVLYPFNGNKLAKEIWKTKTHSQKA
jgi:hypothetical protein